MGLSLDNPMVVARIHSILSGSDDVALKQGNCSSHWFRHHLEFANCGVQSYNVRRRPSERKHQMSTCHACNGAGSIDICPSCGGQGNNTCYKCSGSGWVADDPLRAPVRLPAFTRTTLPVRCDRCKGSGKIDCVRCETRGKVEPYPCTTCQGTGIEPIPVTC